MTINWDKALALEYSIAEIQGRQELRGVAFDIDRAYDLVEQIQADIDTIDEELLPALPVRVIEGTEVARPFKKDGDYSVNCIKYMGNDIAQVGGAFCRVSFEDFNLGSHDQVKTYLLAHGWIPTTWNSKKVGRKYVRTSPKITEDSFGSVSGDMPRLIVKRAALVARRNLLFNIRVSDHKLTGLINLVRSDGRIEAAGVPQATNTGRFRHKNVVNIPAPRAIYGEQVRKCFIAGEGYTLVGSDAAQLEARMEAHYCFNFEGGKEYAHDLIDGDIHAKNATVFGTDRDGAKSPKYALTYGAQVGKMAETLGCSKGKASGIFDDFWQNNTALAGFRDATKQAWEGRGGVHGGYLIGLDGRRITVRSPHSIVNCMFQSGGSIVVKTATCYLDKWLGDEGINAHQVIHYHDEFQYEVREKDIERFIELSELSFVKAGTYWKLNVPLKGTTNVGTNWYETH